MMPLRPHYDAVIVGAGPAGSVAAAALADQGAKVALIEASPGAAGRFAGEWLHPPAVRVLERLDLAPEEALEGRERGHGFVVFGDDDGEPVRLDYVAGATGWSLEHRDLVEGIRLRAAARDGVDYAPYTRVVAIDGHRVTCQSKEHGSRTEITAGRIIGADGRNSMVREHLGIPDRGTRISHMAGVELHGVTLPSESYGHVFLGGPGPILAYRIGADSVRMCIDVPSSMRRDPQALWDGYAPIVPSRLRGAFHRALEERRISWAANAFSPRTTYGRGHVALVGDAIGHFHPLTAAGMTMGLRDAECLIASSSIAEYQRRREHESYVPELLANALYQVFSRHDRSAVAIRHAVFSRWRESERERDTTMRILACDALGRIHFGGAFVRMAVAAVSQTVGGLAEGRRWRDLPSEIAAFGEWAQWPLASMLPRPVRDSERPQSKPDKAVSWLAPRTPRVTEGPPPPSPPSAEAPDDGFFAEATQALAASAARNGSLHEAAHVLWGLTSVGPSDGIGSPAERAQTTLAERLCGSLSRGASHLPMEDRGLVALGLTRLARQDATYRSAAQQQVRGLLEAQRPNGSFGDAEPTAIALMTLNEACEALPGLSSAASARAATLRALKRAQGKDGTWKTSNGDAEGSGLGAGGEARTTARVLLALTGAGVRPVEPAVRDAVNALARRQRQDGSFGDLPSTAEALEALLAARAQPWSMLQSAAGRLMAEPAIHLSAETLAAVLRSLTAFRRVAAERPACRGRKARRNATQRPAKSPRVEVHATAEQASPAGGGLQMVGGGAGTPKAPAPKPADDDWSYCKDALLEVSRTFARPIAMLPGDLEVAVTCGYLLCRIVDTVEDHPTLPTDERDALYAAFLDFVEGRGSAEPFSALYEKVPDQGPDHELCRNAPRVMRVFGALPDRLQRAALPWVAEMGRGMSLYNHRTPGPDGVQALLTLEDLERYCYFVAGTVGHMLTELFLCEVEVADEQRRVLKKNAEAFGLGLQLVNILKDVTDDRERQVSFIPRTLADEAGLTIRSLTSPENRGAAHRAVAPIFDVARERLDRALDYCLALPSSEPGVRLFCLLPLWMAARTLVLAQGNDHMFIAGEPVKISRPEVEQIITDCVAHADDDAYLRARYAQLWEPDATAAAKGSTAGGSRELN